MLFGEKHFSLTSSVDVKEITQPLKSHRINYFNWLRCYHDSSCTILVNDAGWHKHFSSLKLSGSFSLYDLKQGAYLWEDVINPEICAIARNSFNIDNLFQLIFPKQNYIDIFSFGSERQQSGMVSFYFNHVDLLQNFIASFQEKASALFKQSDQNRIRIPSQMIERTNYNYIAPHNKNSQASKNKKPSSPTPFSLRETQCLKLLANGRTAKEIARTLSISPRTVESYINQAKRKTGTTFKSQLIDAFLRQTNIPMYLDAF